MRSRTFAEKSIKDGRRIKRKADRGALLQFIRGYIFFPQECGDFEKQNGGRLWGKCTKEFMNSW